MGKKQATAVSIEIMWEKARKNTHIVIQITIFDPEISESAGWQRPTKKEQYPEFPFCVLFCGSAYIDFSQIEFF